MSTKKIITGYLGQSLSKIFLAQNEDFWKSLREIRLRVGRPLIALADGYERYFNANGDACGINSSYIPTRQDIDETLALISNYSMYAFSEELRGGYITIPGGHRVGLCGRAVIDRGEIKTLKNLSAVNFRIAHEVKGCADGIMHYITAGGTVAHTMIISPPCCGKTTLLRDIVRRLSNGGHAVSVVDERSEIAGCCLGIPQNDIGTRTDVLDGCPKAAGILLLLRAMSPEVIAVDEIGRAADVDAIEDTLGAGVKLICTAHARGIDDISSRPHISRLISKKIFSRYVVLKRPGEISGVYDADFNML